MLVATAGHIDHGKTTLVKALTGVDTDRLPEEKKRGVSIDIGFAYRKMDDGHVLGFVDVPGHERFVRNMLAGVCAIDYVMLIVSADDGVMPQTIEHLHILDLLKIGRGIAVITKIDRVPAERVAEVAASVRALLAPTGLAAIEILPVSATSGENLDRLREALATAARNHVAREHAGRNVRYSIDRVFTVAGRGTVVTGTVFNGAVAPGDRLVLTPSGIEVRVREIQKDGDAATLAVAGERCALNLAGADVADVHRGDWVVSPAVHAPTRRLAARVQVLAGEAHPLRHWAPVHLHLGTADVTARVSIRRGASIPPGASMIVDLITDRPLAALNGDRFILRDQSATRTIGGGTVIDPFVTPSRRNAEARAARLAALENADPAAALAALLARSPAGVDFAQFSRNFNLTADRALALVGKPDLAVVGKESPVVLSRATVDGIKQGAVDALARFHRESPQAVGVEIAALRAQVAPDLPAATFALLLRELVDAGKMEVSGSGARLPRHVATDNPADRRMWESLKPLLDDGGFDVPPLRELAPAAKVKEAILKDFAHRKAQTGQLIRVTPERFYPRETLAKLAAIAQVLERTVPDGQFTAAQFRDYTGVGRTLAIEILECLDRLGITQRFGNTRKMRKDFVPILGSAVAPPPAPRPRAEARSAPQPQRRPSPHHFRQ